jgi:cupin superfamily acireductone dioxygenase involved in methionine salvage
VNSYALPYLHGLEFFPTTKAVDFISIQAKKHNQKRINKKWLKKYGHKTVEVPSNKYFVMGNKIIAHPDMIEKIKKAIKETK